MNSFPPKIDLCVISLHSPSKSLGATWEIPSLQHPPSPNPLPPLSSSVHFTERRIGFAWCFLQSAMVSVSRLAGLYMLCVSAGCMWNLSEQLPNHGPQCRSHHISILVCEDFDLFAYKQLKRSFKFCGVWRGSAAMIRHQLWLHLSFVAEERKKACSPSTKGGATFSLRARARVCAHAREILGCALRYLQSANYRGTIL